MMAKPYRVVPGIAWIGLKKALPGHADLRA